MQDWHAKALKEFSELEPEINRNQGSPVGLWADLFCTLRMAYHDRPADENLIGRIYDDSAWCLERPETENVESDLSSAAAVALLENIPLDCAVSGDLYRWMSVGFESFSGITCPKKHSISSALTFSAKHRSTRDYRDSEELASASSRAALQ
jgi:hypothetical protein